MRLRGVLDHRHAELEQLGDGCRPAVEVNRDDSSGRRADGLGRARGRDDERVRLDVDEDGTQTSAPDRSRRRGCGEVGADHLRARREVEAL